MNKLMQLTAVTLMTVGAVSAANAGGDMTAEQKQAKVDAKFAEVDTNKDGVINMSEHNAASKKMFDDADTNNDDMVSKAEKLAYMEKEWAKK